MSTIVDHTGRRHRTTTQDLLWLGRALDGEGGDEFASATTLLQRWAMLGGSEVMPLRQLVEYYCQPIHPDWLQDGRQCSPGGAGYGRPSCSPEVMQERAWRRVKAWSEIRQEARDAAVRALYSHDAEMRLPDSVHFATRELVAEKMSGPTARREGWRVLPDQGDGHSYISTTASRLGRARIQVEPGPLSELNALEDVQRRELAIRSEAREEEDSEGGSVLPLVALVAVGAGVAYAAKSGALKGVMKGVRA